jgi:hypothetical protein
MKYLRLLLILLCIAAGGQAQEIPEGVRYKKASDDINNLAKSGLEKALSSATFPSTLFGKTTVVGPMLWNVLKPGAGKDLLNSKPFILVVPGKSSFATEGKALLADNERHALWKSITDKYVNLKTGKVRKAKAEEISYFWSTIPFDIEEPFWVIETSSDRFIASFEVKSGQPQLFWIDVVGDLQKLRP